MLQYVNELFLTILSIKHCKDKNVLKMTKKKTLYSFEGLINLTCTPMLMSTIN